MMIGRRDPGGAEGLFVSNRVISDEFHLECFGRWLDDIFVMSLFTGSLCWFVEFLWWFRVTELLAFFVIGKPLVLWEP